MSYIFGFNLGISSIGWAVYSQDNNSIVNLGVHCFDPAEHPKDGKSLALPRREARGQRRRIRRRAYRMKKIKSFLVNSGLITHGAMELLYTTRFNKYSPEDYYNAYALRAKALNEKLSNEELVKSLVHIAKHRGFKSNRKGADKDKDSKVMKSAMRENQELLIKYRSVGEMFYLDPKFSDRKRNFTGDYRAMIVRSDLEAEAKLILAKQAAFGNKLITESFIDTYLRMFNWQKSFDWNNNIIGMVGKCQFEKDELRAPKACFNSEMFVALSKLNNIRYEDDSIEHKLSSSEVNQIINLALDRKTKKFNISFATLRKELQLSDNARFNFVKYEADVDFLETEKRELVNELEFKAFHLLKNAIYEVDKDAWVKILSDNNLFNQIGIILTYNKTDETIISALEKVLINFTAQEKFNIVNAIIDNGIEFKYNLNLSLKVISKLIPFLKDGITYDKACEKAGYVFTGNVLTKHNKLPSLKELRIDQDLTNPVTIRAISQFRKLINSLIRQYGAPYQINMQLMRDIGKTKQKRNEITSNMKKRQVRNQQLFDEFSELFGVNPVKDELLRYRLWKQQAGKCLLSQKSMPVEAVRHGNYLCQVTSILPRSRSFDDSMDNKILAYTAECQNKGNQSVYEYLMFSENKLNWLDEYSQHLMKTCASYGYSYKKHKLLGTKKFNDDDYINRNLQDSSYVADYCYNYVRRNLKFADPKHKLPVRVITGLATGFLRSRWGFWKDKNANVLHNAIDAAVVASFTEAMKQKVTKYLKLEEQSLGNQDDYTDQETGEIFEYFPRPHLNFKWEVLGMLNNVFVSRMPRHTISGKVHDDTIRSVKFVDNPRPDYFNGKPFSMVRKPLKSSGIKLNEDGSEILNLAPMYKHSRPNLYFALKKRLETHENDCAKAFNEPFYGFDENNEPTNNLVKSIKTYQMQNNGVKVHGGTGVADNGGIVRSDVFEKDGKFYIVPIYQSFARKGMDLPNKATGEATIDETYKFKFSLFNDDLIKISQGEDPYYVYYNSLNYFAGKIVVENHDKSPFTRKNIANKDSKPIIQRSIAITTLKVFEKWNIDILGNQTKVRSETRLRFA